MVNYTQHTPSKNRHTKRTGTSGLFWIISVSILLHPSFRLLKALLKMSSSYSRLLFSSSFDSHGQFRVSTLVNSPRPQNPSHHTKGPWTSGSFCVSILNSIFLVFFLSWLIWYGLKFSNFFNLQIYTLLQRFSHNKNLTFQCFCKILVAGWNLKKGCLLLLMNLSSYFSLTNVWSKKAEIEMKTTSGQGTIKLLLVISLAKSSGSSKSFIYWINIDKN